MKPLSRWQKEETTKQDSKQLIAHTIVIALLFCLILAIEYIRRAHCINNHTVLAPSPPLQHDPLSTTPVDATDTTPQTRLMTASRSRHERALPQCAASRTTARTFLMVFMGHSGSSALLSELAAHSKVYVENPELVDHQPRFNTTAALETTRAFFDRGIANGQLPGFKIRPRHLMNEPHEWRKLVEHYDTRIIWQYRKNFFKGALGEYKRRFLNDTSVVEGFRSNMTEEQRCELGTCSFAVTNFSFLHALVREGWRSQRNIVSGMNVVSRDGCIREAPYEDYLHTRVNTLKDMFRFLGLDFEETQPSRFKATSDNLCEVVTNWEDLCRKFYLCPTMSYLLEDDNNNCYCPVVSGSTELCEI